MRGKAAGRRAIRADCQWWASRWTHTATVPSHDDRRFVMASSHAAAAPRRRASSPAPSPNGAPNDVHPVLRRAGAPPAALDLLVQARGGLDEAAVLDAPNERYATPHLAALRTAA